MSLTPVDLRLPIACCYFKSMRSQWSFFLFLFVNDKNYCSGTTTVIYIKENILKYIILYLCFSLCWIYRWFNILLINLFNIYIYLLKMSNSFWWLSCIAWVGVCTSTNYSAQSRMPYCSINKYKNLKRVNKYITLISFEKLRVKYLTYKVWEMH